LLTSDQVKWFFFLNPVYVNIVYLNQFYAFKITSTCQTLPSRWCYASLVSYVYSYYFCIIKNTL